MKLKFWNKSQDDAPELPDDIKHSQEERAGLFPSNIQQGHVPMSAAGKGMMVTAGIVCAGIAYVFLRLVWIFVFRT